jgi:hypothetical protein
VSKVKDNPDGTVDIAADLFTFVDDLRPTGKSNAESWQAGRRSGSVLNWLGIQDAPRKRRDSRRDPGAWAGSVVRTEGGVFTLISDEKWDKTKRLLKELDNELDDGPNDLDRKELERTRGFLNYVCQTYKSFLPYLNGFHMTIDGFRENRDEEGWKLPRKSKPGRQCDDNSSCTSATSLDEDWDNWSEEGDGDVDDPIGDFKAPKVEEVEVPKRVVPVPRLREDVKALLELCSADTPPWRRMRAKVTARVFYGFGDASGPAFGAAIQEVKDGCIHYEFGQWVESVTNNESSNWREFSNLVEFLEAKADVGMLDDAEVFMFTDNSTTEGAFWKGTSHSKKLCELVLRLRKLEMQTGMVLHVVHVSGKRMIASGVDGLSRSDHSTGVMAGHDVVDYVPLHLGALERSPPLKEWLEDVTRDCGASFLSPEGWFEDTNKEGAFVWSPPPAAADVVVERLGIAKHKRPNSLHLVVVPRLMTGRWRKHLSRATDGYIKLDDPALWDLTDQFEPVLVFVSLPFLPHRPDFQRRRDLFEQLRGLLQGEDMQAPSAPLQRDLLRKLLHEARALPAL